MAQRSAMRAMRATHIATSKAALGS